MSNLRLVIGNRNYSSWSLRAWLPLRHCGATFETLLVPLDTPEFEQRIGALSPTRKVPVLWHGDLCIWDSLAIGEYVNECFAGNSLWPADPSLRALGRSMAAEMHSGFTHLRSRMPMNCRARDRSVEIDSWLQADIGRVWILWRQARAAVAGQGSWLLGEYSLLDAMFTPVVLRFQTYGVAVPEDLKPWCRQVLADPCLLEWLSAALDERWIVDADEAGSSSG